MPRERRVNVTLATVLIPGPLRAAAGGADTVEVEGRNLKQVIDELCRIHPALGPLILDEAGSLHHHLAVFVDGVEVRAGAGLFAEVREDSEVILTPALSGG